MATKKISYTNLKLKINNSTEKVQFADTEIDVLQYLPIEDKYDLVMITLQQAFEDGIYNPIKVELFFHLNLVYMYTNINFTDKQKEDYFKLYDNLTSNGLMDLIIEKIPSTEYNTLFNYMNEIIDSENHYRTSASALIQSIINDLPKQAQAAMDIVDKFDPDKFQAVKDFAKAANGGRDI